MFKSISKVVKKFTCNHISTIGTVYIQDRIYDEFMDNDDLEDSPTFIKIKYCTKCGKILHKVHSNKTDNFAKCYGFGNWIKVYQESDYELIRKFEQITNINIKELTLYKVS